MKQGAAMKTLLVGLDNTPESASVLASAVALALPTGAKITLLHVVDVPAELPPPGSLLLVLPTSKNDLVLAARQHLALLAEDVPAALRGDIVVETGNPADVICDVARDRDASMVLIGAHRHGVVRRVLGTTAAHVVNQIDRPLVVVRAPAAGGKSKRPSDELRAEHEGLEDVYADLTRAYRGGDWRDVQSMWTAFDLWLRTHMNLEEQSLRPAFDELLTRLRAHSAHVEQLFHPWLDGNHGAPDALASA